MKKFFFLFLLFLFIPIAKASFGDLPKTHQYYPAITYLQEKNIIKGYSDNTVRAGSLINRAEFVKMIMEGFQIPVSTNTKKCFRDVKNTEWFAKYLCGAKEQGVISGLKNGKFEPARTINKVESLKIILNAAKIPQKKPITLPFNDVKADDWFYEFVLAAFTGNYLEEQGPLFEPSKQYNRGQMSEILYRIVITKEEGKDRYEDEKPPIASSSELDYTALQLFALDHVNQLRAEEGKPPLKLNPLLNTIATIHSKDMAFNIKQMSHDGSLGETAHERIKEGKVPDLEKKVFTFVPFPDNIERSAENVGMRNIKNFGGDPEKAIISQHQFYMNEPEEGVNHRTIMMSLAIPASEVGIGLFLDDNKNLWITEDFISTQDE